MTTSYRRKGQRVTVLQGAGSVLRNLGWLRTEIDPHEGQDGTVSFEFGTPGEPCYHVAVDFADGTQLGYPPECLGFSAHPLPALDQGGWTQSTTHDHMRNASYLLPDPGGEVVRFLLDKLEAAEGVIEKVRAEAAVIMGQAAEALPTGAKPTRAEFWRGAESAAKAILRRIPTPPAETAAPHGKDIPTRGEG